jgi:hypothetical protein
VPQDSAILPGYIAIGIRDNHMDMARFVSTDDPGFVAVCGELRRWVKGLGAVRNGPESRPVTGQHTSNQLSNVHPDTWDIMSLQTNTGNDDLVSACRRDLRVVDPQHDIKRIEKSKDKLLNDVFH